MELAGLFFAPMPMMMSVLGPGLLGLMSNISMKGNFVAHLGHQVLDSLFSLLILFFNVNIRVIKEIWVSNIHIKVTENIMWVSGAICAGV